MAARTSAILLIAWTLIIASAGNLLSAQRGPVPYAGRPVADVLKELQAAQLKVIFSSELVPARLRVVKEPTASDARQIAIQILEPHGLTLQDGPGGTLIVVSKPRPAPREPAPRRQPDADATTEAEPLRLAERVDVTDRPIGSTTSARVYAVEPAAVTEMAGALDNVLQTLQVLPGVAGVNDEDGKLAVRGAGPQHNMVMLDGVQIHNVQRLGEYTASFFNPATAATISLDPSGLDAQFGGRLSSVINLQTRDGTTERALALSGSLGLNAGDVLVEGRMPGTANGSWWATARGTYYRFVTDRVNDGAMPSFADVQFKTTLYPSRRTRVTIFGLAGREMLRDLDQEQDGTIVTRISNDGHNRIAAATFRWMPSSRFSSATTVSAYSYGSQHVDRMLAFVADIDAFDRRSVVDDFAIRQQWVYAPTAHRAIDAGLDLHRVRSSWRMKGLKQPEWWRGVGPSVWGEMVDYSAGPFDSRLERTQAGGWFQVRLDAGRVMTLEPGLRLDWNSFTGEASWQPRLRVSRAFGKTVTWVGYSVQAQTPSHESLQGFEYFDFAADGAPQGLRNERTQQIVAGFERALAGGFGLRVETYTRSFDRLMMQRRETDSERANRLSVYVLPDDLPPDSALLEHRPTVFPVSEGTGRAAGLEVLLRRDRRRIGGWIAYTLSTSTRDLFGREVPSDFDRRHAFNAVVGVPISARWKAAATIQMATGFPTTPVVREVAFGQSINLGNGTRDPFYRAFRNRDGTLITIADVFQRRLSTVNSERLTGYSRVDARLTYSTVRHWEFYGEVLNLFNHRNYLQRVDHGPDAEGHSGVSMANIYGTFERMISFGVRAKF